MSQENFSEKKKKMIERIRQLGPMNEIRLQKENEDFLEKMWHSMRSGNVGVSRTHFSSSQMAICNQLESPKDHVHFEDCHTLSRYLNLITDIEVEWFDKCCEDVTRIGWLDWRSREFFNVRAYVHWMKWGSFLKELVYYVEPKRMRQTMQEMFASHRDMEAMLLLTHGQLTCHVEKKNTLEFSTPVKLYCPCLENGTLINVQPWGPSDYHEGHPLLMRQFSAWHDISCIDDVNPSQDISMEEEGHQDQFPLIEEEDSRIAYNYEVFADDPVEESWVVSDGLVQLEIIKPIRDPLYTLESEMERSVNALNNKPQEEGVSVSIESEGLQDKLVITHEANLDMYHMPLSLSMPFEGLTISQQRWIDSKEPLLPICLYPVVSVDHRPVFIINGIEIFKETGGVYLTHWHIKQVKNNCFCCDNTVVCRTHGATCYYLGRQMSVYCGPYKGDVFHVPRMTPQSWLTNSWTRPTLSLSPKFENKEMRIDLRWASHPYTFPYVLPGEGGPVSYFSRTDQISYEIEFEGSFFHFRVGPQQGIKNFFPVELLFLLFSNLFETDLAIRTVYLVFKIEQSFTYFHLQYLKGEYLCEEEMALSGGGSCSSEDEPSCRSILESAWKG